MEEIKLAYLYVKQTIAGGYLGGVLVCDTKGFPLEFRYTEPIFPTKIQKVLYGHNLDKYLKVDVLLDSLLKVLGTKYDVLIVNDSKLLESDTPIIQMEIGQNPILSGNEWVWKSIIISENLELLVQLQNKGINGDFKLRFCLCKLRRDINILRAMLHALAAAYAI